MAIPTVGSFGGGLLDSPQTALLLRKKASAPWLRELASAAGSIKPPPARELAGRPPSFISFRVCPSGYHLTVSHPPASGLPKGLHTRPLIRKGPFLISSMPSLDSSPSMAQATPVPAGLALPIIGDLAQLVPLTAQYWKMRVHDGDWT